jgi:hypothetical protein
MSLIKLLNYNSGHNIQGAPVGLTWLPVDLWTFCRERQYYSYYYRSRVTRFAHDLRASHRKKNDTVQNHRVTQAGVVTTTETNQRMPAVAFCKALFMPSWDFFSSSAVVSSISNFSIARASSASTCALAPRLSFMPISGEDIVPCT